MTQTPTPQLVCALSTMLLATGLAAQDQQRSEAAASKLVAATQQNDAARIRAVFAPDARQAYGDRAPRSGDDLWDWLTTDIIEPHGRVGGPKLSVIGPAVVLTGRYRNDQSYSNDADFLLQIEDGSIVSWQMRY